MSDSTKRFMVRVPDGMRTLFSIIEKPSGELIVPIKFGDRFGPNWKDGHPIIEQRYSIHTSSKSAEFNVIKQTLKLAGGATTTLAALTDAVKNRSGFFLVLVRRCQDLARAPAKPVLSPHNEEIYVLAEYDPSLFNLYHGIFVGHPDSVFDASIPGVIFTPVRFKYFQIVVATSLYFFPSYHTTEFVHSITIPPEIDPEERESRRYLMAGKSADICLRQYNNSVRLLTRRLLETILRDEVLDPESIEMINEDLEKLGEVELTPVGDEAKQATHMLTDCLSPNPQSEKLHAEFLRVRDTREG